MLRKDRTLLRNITLAALLSTGVAIVIGTSCLGSPHRDYAQPDLSASQPADTQSSQPSLPPTVNVTINNNESVRSSAGGVSSEPVGTTRITSAEMNSSEPATPNSDQPVMSTSTRPVQAAPAAQQQPPQQQPPPTVIIQQAPPQAPMPAPAVPQTNQSMGQSVPSPTTTPPPQVGAGPLTQPDTYGASSYIPPPATAGAGPFSSSSTPNFPPTSPTPPAPPPAP